MKDHIKTNQYSLELLSLKMASSFFLLIENNRDRLEDFFAGTVGRTKTLEETKSYCEAIENKIVDKRYFPYLIVEEATGKLVGLIDIKNIDWDIPKAELGAFIDKAYEGKGIINHYGNRLIDEIVSKHEFKKLYCRVASRNKRSVSLVNRAGFQLEGRIRRDYRTTRGELVDLDYYGKLFN